MIFTSTFFLSIFPSQIPVTCCALVKKLKPKMAIKSRRRGAMVFVRGMVLINVKMGVKLLAKRQKRREQEAKRVRERGFSIDYKIYNSYNTIYSLLFSNYV